jgi:cobalt-zinc-cadmium efflux system membrane fusion protein
LRSFLLTSATQIESASELTATGSVFPDVSREIPVISLANGRVVDIKTRLDDNVKKGQLLLKVQSPDITAAFNTYLKAANDEHMANKAYVARR